MPNLGSRRGMGEGRRKIIRRFIKETILWLSYVELSCGHETDAPVDLRKKTTWCPVCASETGGAKG